MMRRHPPDQRRAFLGLSPDGSGGCGSIGFGAEAGSSLCSVARSVRMQV
jgi:hypothetical protein